MRKYLHIDLAARSVESTELHGEALTQAGRYFIAKTLLERGVAEMDPLGPENPLIFSAGPFAGTNFSNANRISVGCKSPLTGGIKEANGGGTFAVAMGHLEIAGFTLNGAGDEWVVIRIPKEGPITFDSAEPYMGKGNFEAAALLHETYGDKTSIALCGPVGEYLGLVAGIAFSDVEARPVRLAARGGVGAVMGAKKVKAIVIDKFKMPPLHDRRKVMGAVKEYGKKLREQVPVQNMSTYGTAMMADVMNHMGGLPVRNFSAGSLVDTAVEPMKMGGDYIHDQNQARGGMVSHACMPGCLIKCSNIYVDSEGKEVVSPLEYETIGLMGTNCGIKDPDEVAHLNAIANDLGVDTIETGATLAVLMEAGEAAFADVGFMEEALEDIRRGNERGRLLAQGTARVGAHYGVARVPVIKKQAISAYDPRVVEVTGISMMLTAQGADHTTGNLPAFDCKGKTVAELTEQSFTAQVGSAIADSMGLCIFGRSVTDTHRAMIADAVNSAHDTAIDAAYIERIGRETLWLEAEFNRRAGFTQDDDELPEFFMEEPLAPSGKAGRLKAQEVNACMSDIKARYSE
jgi:aldehyde:ferredoxin oxidoreductase